MLYRILFLLIFFTANLDAGNNDMFHITKPYTRWWWFAEDKDTNDIKYQLDWLKDNNFGGVEIAWVYPPVSDSLAHRPAWQSADWSALVAFAKSYADSIGLGCDFTFGTLWPFGDSKVPESEGSLQYHDSISPLSMRLTWEHPVRGRVINHLDRKAFYNYAERMGTALSPALQGSMSSIFCDSWEVETKQIWTKGLDKAFKERYGYDILPLMDTLYSKRFERHYYNFMQLVSEYVLKEFYAPFAFEARKLGAYSRVQCGGAPCDLLNAFALVDIPETEAILYEPKFTAIPLSAAILSSKPIVSSETFTCLYGWKRWPGPSPHQNEEQIADLKLLADALFANGVNMILWHGMPYNAEGSDNKFYASVHVGPKSNMAPYFKPFNAYMDTVSQFMRKGKAFTQCAVYYPWEDALMAVEYPDSLKFPWVWGQYEMRYISFPAELKGYQPIWINREFLALAKLQNGKLQCGDASLSFLYLNTEFMDIESLKLILGFASKGFPVCMARKPKCTSSGVVQYFDILLDSLSRQSSVAGSLAATSAPRPIVRGDDLPDFRVRADGDDFYIFFANPRSANLKYPLKYGISKTDETLEKLIEINIEKLQIEFKLIFAPYQSILLKVNRKGKFDIVDINYNPPEPRTEKN